MADQILRYILIYFPTNLLGLYAALEVQGARVPAGRLLAYGGLLGLIVAGLRAIPGPFGLHVPLIILVMVLMVRHLSQGRWSMAVLSTLLPFLITGLGEALIGVPVLISLGLELADTLNNPWWAAAGTWLSNAPLIGLVGFFVVVRSIRRRHVGG